MERLGLARLLGAPAGAAEPSAAPRIIEDRDPGRFMAALASAVAGTGPVFLADPAWGATERAALTACLEQAAAGPAGRGWLMIPSGGTSGRLKFARHDEETMAAAVRGFCTHFEVTRVSCVGVLPLHHVSGLMAWMRTALTGGQYLAWDWKRLEAGDLPPAPQDGSGWFLSLVPTQLQRLLGSPESVAWLNKFQAVFIGGGPVWPGLADAAARAGLPISLSYGLTETAAMVAALRPAEFLAGSRSSGTALAHVRLDLTADGLVRASGESIFRGYFPEWREAREFVSDDLGRFDAEGRIEILGRSDALIITGGEKADPLEIERALRASGEFLDVAVVGLADPDWGHGVVACYPENQPPPDAARVDAQLQQLAAYKRPRRYLAMADWPRNAQGKLNRAELARLAENMVRG
jgi:O-succinylbenzoic acid--CoA ligase